MNSEVRGVPARSYALLAAALLPIVFGGCESMSHTDKGLLGGAGLGAVAGGLLGAAVRRPVAGAAIGAAVGGVAGASTGAAIDHSERKAQAAAFAAQHPPLALEQVVALTASGSTDEVIINQIRLSGSVYHLSPDQIIYLQNSGVRQPIITEMQATAYRMPRYVYTAAPVYGYPPAPPPVAVGIGFGFRGR